MNVSDIGADLWALVHHLYTNHGRKAFRELCLRTGTPISPEDAALGTVSMDRLKDTAWYHAICLRYQHQQDVIKVQHRSRFEEIEEMTQMLYPKGCSLSDYAEAVQSCVSMLTFTIPDSVITSFLQKQDELRAETTSYSVTGEELVDDMKLLVQESVFPRQWWRHAAPVGSSSTAQVKVSRIGLRCQPPEILVEYVSASEGDTKRCRRIHLPRSVLDMHQPVGPIARRLALAHGMLISETEFQRLLLDIQRIDQRQREEKAAALGDSDSPGMRDTTKVSREVSPNTGAAELGTKASGPSESGKSTTHSKAPQAADLCLLYRDPEAALENVDLNHADDDTVKEFKDVMDIKFNENAIKPGDEGYVYDKRVAVNPSEKSEWDDDSDEEE